MNSGRVIATLLFLNLRTIHGESYIPAYIEGTPLSGKVMDNAPADIRNEPLFRIEHKVRYVDFLNLNFMYL